jgi:hypothetical protein
MNMGGRQLKQFHIQDEPRLHDERVPVQRRMAVVIGYHCDIGREMPCRDSKAESCFLENHR